MSFRIFFVLHFLILAKCPAAEPTVAPCYAEHLDLSYVLRSDGGRASIRTEADWQQRRAHIVAGMEAVMGPLPHPATPVPLDVQVLEEHHEEGIIRRKLAYHTNLADKQVKAWLLLPTEKQAGDKPTMRRPAMLCLHQTTLKGKDSPAGLADRPSMHLALELARRGYVTLAPDYPSLGEYDYDFESDEYESGSMVAIYDNRRAIDLLQSLPEVDPERIGGIGHSLGGHNSLFTAVFDERIKAVVTSCGFTRFHKYYKGDLHGWAGPRYMPLITSKYGLSPDRMPFDFTEVIAALAPRPVFIVAPLADDNFDVQGVRDVVAAAQPIYQLFHEPDHLKVIYPDSAHDFPEEARMEVYGFLDRFLKRPK